MARQLKCRLQWPSAVWDSSDNDREMFNLLCSKCNIRRRVLQNESRPGFYDE